jgi:hypothetical protein
VIWTDRLKLTGFVTGVALLLVLAWNLASPLLVGWPLCIYVCWRAGPGIAADLRALHEKHFPANDWRI